MSTRHRYFLDFDEAQRVAKDECPEYPGQVKAISLYLPTE